MRSPARERARVRKIVLTIAGSDSSGGAGIQADLKAIAAHGSYGASVVTAITAQNTTGVLRSEPVAASLVRDQLEAVFADLPVAAVKTGMLAGVEVVDVVGDVLARERPPAVVCDPVMISKSGFSLTDDACAEAIVRRIFPLASLVTPNVHEAEKLSGIRITAIETAVAAGRAMLADGAVAVLVKGGHLAASPGTDVLVTAGGVRELRTEWVDSDHTHGTGCTYASSIATLLAQGAGLEDAIERSKEFLTHAIRAGLAVGSGCGPTDPFWFLGEGSRAAVTRGARRQENE